MKRTFTQKVKHVPSCAADSFDALLKLSVGKHSVGAVVPTEVNRRTRTSAAMIGLAISMGAAGLLLPQQGDEAMAVEPVAAEPNLPTLPLEPSADPSASVAPAQAVEPGVVAVSTPSMPVQPKAVTDFKPTPPPVVEHQVQQGETLWQLSKSYEVQPEAIAASNKIQPSAILPVGQKLKIPSVNGIVHEVKAGETVETLSESYGVKPTQLQASAPVSESSQLQTGESVTVPGNVNDLLKVRQEVALNNLKEHGNRINDSLAELRSEESTNLSEQETTPSSVASAAEQVTPVTLPPAVLKPEDSGTNAAKPGMSVPTSPVVIPVPTPEIAATPAIEPKAATPPEQSVVIPVPTPEIAATPAVEPKAAKLPEQSVVLPVPTPEIAATPAVEPKAPTVSTLGIGSVTTPQTPGKPQVPQPVVMQTLMPGSSANVYQVKPGDTLDAIARRNGISSSQLIQANGLNNPNLIRINQQLRIPQAQPAGVANQGVTLLSGVNSKSDSSATGQEPQGVTAPNLSVPPLPERVTASQQQALPRPVLAQSTVVGSAKPNSSVVVDTRPSQSANSESNPYIEKLRADILRLREEYGHKKEGGQASASRNITVPTVTTPVASSLNNASTPPRINPEFNPKRHNETLQAELERRRQQQQVQKGPIQIEVPPPATASVPPPGLVAAAPAAADSYNPMIRTPVGQTVSPELPSLSAPDMYLPDSPAQFNGYIWPTKGVITSGYGRRWGRMHKGIDIAAPVGTPVLAAAPGVVVSAGWNSGGYGNLVEIQHPDGSLTLYAHNNRVLVRRGQQVAQGQQISEMGSTGRSTGPHCHFEVHAAGRGAVNPIAVLPRS